MSLSKEMKKQIITDYATKDGDVLFTRIRHKWIESKGCYDFEITSSNSGCMTVIVAVIVTSLIALL